MFDLEATNNDEVFYAKTEQVEFERTTLKLIVYYQITTTVFLRTRQVVREYVHLEKLLTRAQKWKATNFDNCLSIATAIVAAVAVNILIWLGRLDNTFSKTSRSNINAFERSDFFEASVVVIALLQEHN